MVAEFFALVNVGNVHLNGGKFNCRNRVPKGHRGVRVGARVDDDAHRVPARRVDGVNQVALVVGLQALALNPAASAAAVVRLRRRTGLPTVNARFAGAQKVQVGAVENQQGAAVRCSGRRSWVNNARTIPRQHPLPAPQRSVSQACGYMRMRDG